MNGKYLRLFFGSWVVASVLLFLGNLLMPKLGLILAAIVILYFTYRMASLTFAPPPK